MMSGYLDNPEATAATIRDGWLYTGDIARMDKEGLVTIVVLRDGSEATEQELIDFVKQRKGSMMEPKSVEFWDAIPLTNLGKLDRKTIRGKFWRGRERNI